jgi:hypothetical protein
MSKRKVKARPVKVKPQNKENIFSFLIKFLVVISIVLVILSGPWATIAIETNKAFKVIGDFQFPVPKDALTQDLHDDE